jgi:hypothetical protein
MAPFIPVAPKKKRAENAHESKSVSLPAPQPTRIGFGEYFHPTLFDKAGVYARLEFIGKIEEVAQDVLVDLARSVRPDYEAVKSVMDESDLLSLNTEALRNLAKDDQNEFAALLVALDAWIERHNLDGDWVRDMVLRTLFHWTGRIVAGQEGQLRFTAPISAPNLIKVDEVPFSFSNFGWIITNETRKAFATRTKAQFDFHLAEYVKGVERRAEEAGWKKTPAIRKSGKDSDSFRHFEWLVRWQCQGWTTPKAKSAKKPALSAGSPKRADEPSTYANESDRRRKAAYRTVHDGLTKAALLLDLKLRPGKAADQNILSQ